MRSDPTPGANLPVRVCLSLQSSTVHTRLAKSLLAPRMMLPVVSKSNDITAALLPVKVDFNSAVVPLLTSQIFIFLSAPAVAKNLPEMGKVDKNLIIYVCCCLQWSGVLPLYSHLVLMISPS